MRLYLMQAGSSLSQIGQRILVAKTCPERVWPAKDDDGILAVSIDSD